ncbi:MAG: mandelate racemase/muconate lactonizing enzyme family protein [Nitriliruptoraceae bacterium]|nr:mandelate racemase/muconate lactonizing enzyme family protein [Nitriliruptoraceae bacterium]
MKIVDIETFRPSGHANVLLLRLRGEDASLVGHGETFYAASSVEAYIHDVVAPILFSLESADPTSAVAALTPYVGYLGSGVETRAISAVDIALWDLHARSLGRSVSQVLGGAVRDDIEIYNTCAGTGYVQGPGGQSVANWGLAQGAPGPYEDLHAFMTRPGELAEELVEAGIGGMKVWPFDPYAERHGGRRIDRDELARGVGVVEAIRAAVGDRIDVMVELHGLWDLPTARRIVSALDGLDVSWIEDPIRADHLEALAALTADSPIPIAGGETVAGAASYRRLLAADALDIPIVDPTWTGGLSEAVRVARVAKDHGRPVAAHDCTGPVSLAVCTHLSLTQPNALVQETVRAHYHGWYADLVTELPPIAAGRISAPPGVGLGLEFVPDLAARPDVSVRVSQRPGPRSVA